MFDRKIPFSEPLKTKRATGGMVSAPHFLAARTGQRILHEGGSAIDAMVAMAASIAVVYPHMNSIGGDGFWLIHKPGNDPFCIDAAGPSAALADFTFYKDHPAGLIPDRGAASALTVAGTIGGWQVALEQAEQLGCAPMPLQNLLKDAIAQAEQGIDVTETQSQLIAEKLAQLKPVPGFADTYLIDGKVPEVGDLFKQPALANTLKRLAEHGLDDYYRGELAATHAAYLEEHGSPLRLSDLQNYRAEVVTPLKTELSNGTVYNMRPPTQGISALMILAIYDRLGIGGATDSFAHVHGLVEATKQAFRLRNAGLADEAFMENAPETWLEPDLLDELADGIDMNSAQPWPDPGTTSDTIWMGAIDKNGLAVSFIQSIYWEFGSGLTNPKTGVVWQNRGLGFSMDPDHPNALAPHKRPFHTLNPAYATLKDGRSMVYGTMGGEGQPQTQAAIYSRYAMFGEDLQDSITAPRWLLGRTWGDQSTTLKVENRFSDELCDALSEAGHDVEKMEAFTSIMGHAGAVVRHADGQFEGANDPRSDGEAAGV